MIKKISLLFVLILAFNISKSQVLISLLFGEKLNSDKIEFGLDMGLNYSVMSGFESAKQLSAFNIGFYFDFKLKKQWYINTGVLVKSNVGLGDLRQSDVAILDPTTFYLDSGTYEQKISYFHVPILIKHRFKNHFYAQLGPQVALRTKAFLEFNGEKNNKSVLVKTDNRDLFNRIEVAALAGIGYKLRKGTGMNIGIRYMYGFTNIFKDGYFNSKNSSFYLAVGIPIGRENPAETK
jgi:outer membrane protein with beta-barrel domain